MKQPSEVGPVFFNILIVDMEKLSFRRSTLWMISGGWDSIHLALEPKFLITPALFPYQDTQALLGVVQSQKAPLSTEAAEGAVFQTEAPTRCDDMCRPQPINLVPVGLAIAL